MKKQEVVKLLDRFPDELDPEQLIDQLYLKVKLERAEKDVAEGRTVPHDAVVEQTRTWSK